MFAFCDRVGEFIKGQRGLWAYAFCVFLGALSALAFPPYPFIPFFMLSIVFALLLISTAEKGKQAFIMGFCYGLGQFGTGLYWIGYSFFAQSDVPVWLAPIAVFLLVLYLSLYPGMVFLLSQKLWHTNWVQRAMAFAALYAGTEFLRGWEYVLTGFPWNPAALVWWPSAEMLQNLSVLGTYGVGLITVFCSGLFAAVFDRETARRARVFFPFLSLLILTSMYAYGWDRLDRSANAFHDGLVLRLAQGNIPQTEKWDPPLARRNLEKYLAMSEARDGVEGPVDIVIWPETAVPYDMESPETRTYLMERLDGATLITGAARQTVNPELVLNNSIYVIGAGGRMEARYDKTHLVPFGEYIPKRNILGNFGLNTLVKGTVDFSAGEGITTLNVRGIPAFSPLICYEIIFPGKVTDRGHSPEWILNLTNDAWFGTSSGPYQHFQMARARAIEEGIPVVRVAGTGITAVVDGYGRVQERLDLGDEGFIDARLPKKIGERTLYSRFPIWPFAILAILFLFAGIGPGHCRENGNH